MGGYISSEMKRNMDENMKTQQEFQARTQLLMLERQAAMQQLAMERQLSMQLARAREMFNWVLSVDALVSTGLIVGLIKTRKPALLAPLLGINTATAYQYDLCHGSKMRRIRGDAEHILKHERELITLPNGLITVKDIEKYRFERLNK